MPAIYAFHRFGEQALATLLRRAGIPDDRQRLQSALAQIHQVLLHGIQPEGVEHLEFLEFAVRAIGGDEIALAAPGKEGGHASVVEAGVLEVAEHGIRAGMGHGVMVLGLAPGAVLLAVAAGTTVTADKPGGHRRCRSCWRRYLGCGRRSRRRPRGLLADQQADHRSQQQHDGKRKPAPASAGGISGYRHVQIQLLSG